MRRLSSKGGAILLAALLAMCATAFGPNLQPQARATAAANDTLVFGSTTEPDSLNPIITVSAVGTDVDSAVYDSLVASDQNNTIYSQLATSYSHSADGRTWTFHLRHGVRWGDGQPFTSADVAYTERAILNPKNLIVTTLGWDQIDKLSAPDKYTVIFHLRKVVGPFLVLVGYTMILPQHIYDKPGVNFNTTTFNRTPFGTGPYMVSEWKAADHITLVPNPYSWRGQPFFKKIIYKIVPNNNTQLVQLSTGALDMGVVSQDLVDQARHIPGKRLVVGDANAWYHIDLKEWSFLRETVVRQALDYATPKEAIFRGILKGLGQIAYADIDPAYKQYYNPNMPKHPFSLAKAAAMLAADGFTKGPDGVLQKGGQPFAMELWTISNDNIGQRIDQLLKNLWGSIGIKVTLRSQGAIALFGPTGPQFTRQMTGINQSWFNIQDPDDCFHWTSSQIPKSPTSPGGEFVGYFHPFDWQKQSDALCAAAGSTLDPAQRRAAYVKLQALLADKLPAIFLYWQPSLTVVPSNLTGFKPTAWGSQFWNVIEWRRG